MEYEILFEDGDIRPDTPRRDILTIEDCSHKGGTNLDTCRREVCDGAPTCKAIKTVNEVTGLERIAEKKQRFLQLRSRCYAKWTDGRWYWGRVESADYKDKKYTVRW